MFLGHFGIALGAKKAAPKASLGMLILAAQFADLLWPIFLLLGWEQVRIAPGITRVTPLYFAVRRNGRAAPMTTNPLKVFAKDESFFKVSSSSSASRLRRS